MKWMCIVVPIIVASMIARPAAAQSHSNDDCQPQPDCRLIVSPLNPGSHGIGIRDKGLVPDAPANIQQPDKKNFIKGKDPADSAK
jgi:hypothetical protein